MPGPISRLPTSGTAVRRLLIAAMVIGFASLIAAGIAAAWVTSRNQQHSAAVVHTYQVEQAIAVYRVLIEQAETARRGYIVDQRPSFLNSYQIAAAALPAALDRIAALTADNPHEIERVRRLRALTTQLGALRERTNDLVGSGRMADAVAAFREDASVPTMRNVRAIGEQMIREERGLLASRDAVQKASVRLFFVILSIAGVLLVLVAVTTLVTVLRYTRDLQASRDALRDLADSLEEAVQERTADLTRANEEIQRFAYIVSHDLRSPLVNVMGFTAELDAATKAVAELIDRAEQEAPDLVTEEARLAAREDLPEAIGFIRSSTEKMDRLINAILKLSREGRRVLAPERLDLDALLDGIRDTLQHRIDEEEIALIVRHPLPEIGSDRVAIEQIFSNLIENAVKYLQPGRKGRIEVRGERQGNRVSFEIEDNGRGIDPRDHARVFDLFRRSGTQDQPGEGIGLAHVRALAYRLGGIIDVSSELGKGATFRLSLPASFTPIQERITMNDQRPVTIVMIEDDEGHARLIEKNIRRAGISNAIEHFTDGTTALHYLYNDQNGPALNGPALILLDLNLPDMSGTDILAKIKSEGPLKRTPVVVLTTTDDKVEIQRCYDLGCNVYITKPVNYESFAQAIRQLGLFLSVIQVPEVEAG